MWRAILRPQLPRLGTSARSRVMLSRPLCTTVAIEPDADQLLRVMHKVQSIVGHSFQMSRIVMVGDQSSGKTSVVESLVGADISVKDQAMATRRPLLLTLMRTERGELWAQFRDGEKLHSAEAIKERIAAENDVVEGDISTNPIELTIYSPHVHDVILIDLPGFVVAPERHQSEDLPEQIMKMNAAYMTDPSNILAIVNPATNDPAGSMALREATRADRGGNRSLGIVTKIDLMSKQSTSMDALLRLLRNEVHPVGLGRIGIRCRTHQEQVENIDFNTVEEREARWVTNSGLLEETPAVRLGVPTLKHALSDLLLHKMTSQLPDIIERLDEKIAEARQNESFLQRLASEPDMRTVAKELETLVNQLHPAADTRVDYEQGLRAAIFQNVQTAVSDACQTFHTPDLEGLTKPTRLIQNTKGEELSRARGYAGGVLNALEYEPDRPERQTSPRHNIGLYRDFLVYSSEAHLDTASDNVLLELRDRACEIGAIAAYFKHSLPEKPRRARTKWSRNLNQMVDTLMGVKHEREPAQVVGGLVNETFGVFMDKLGQFAETVEIGSSQMSSPDQSSLARAYFKFLLEKIATRIQDERLGAEMYGILERERRPMCDFLEVQNELAKAKKFPEPISKLFFSIVDDSSLVDVTMYNKEWTEAYMRVLTKRVSDDMFRIMSVRLLEPLIFESIQFSLNLFNSNSTVIREAKMATKDADELEEIKHVLQAHLDKTNSTP